VNCSKVRVRSGWYLAISIMEQSAAKKLVKIAHFPQAARDTRSAWERKGHPENSGYPEY